MISEFTFHYDSINSFLETMKQAFIDNLHFTMILLIRFRILRTTAAISYLHFTMILLIQKTEH